MAMIRSKKKKKGLDELEQRFLGPGAVQEHEGQTVDPKKELAQRERALLLEASDFGDDLVRYVAMHRSVLMPGLAWGFCLGLYCVRDLYPEGGEAFDDVVEQAATDLVLMNTTFVTDSDEILRIQTELPEFGEKEFETAGDFAEKFGQFISMKKRQLGVGNKQGAYGLGRAFHNLRGTYPADKGGSAAFDELARRAGIYFQENKENKDT